MYSAIIVAAGLGIRTGLPYNKVWHEIHGKPLLDYSLAVFESDIDCAEIIVVTDDVSLHSMQENYINRVDGWIRGGKERQDSVLNGLKHAKMPHVMIHDGARAGIDLTLIERIKEGLKAYDAIAPAMMISDTVKRIIEDQIIEHVSRENLFAMQTPQAFNREALLSAYEKAKLEGSSFSCDISLFSHYGNGKIVFVEGSNRNIKFTTQEDLKILEAILS